MHKIFNKKDNSIKKIIFSLTIFSLVFLPKGVSAESVTTADGTTYTSAEMEFLSKLGEVQESASSVNTLGTGTTKTTETTGTAATAAAEATGTCSIGSILGRLLSSSVGRLTNELSSKLKSSIATKAETILTDKVTSAITLTVPVSDSTTHEKQDYGNENTAALRLKSVGGGAGGSFISGLLDVTDISLDSIMFCIINEIIHYIAQSTITWIQSGFEGNPVFVDNPQSFFTGIADQEAGAFLQSLVDGTTGINICQPFKFQVALNGINAYTNSYKNKSSCSLSKIADTFDNYTSGDWNSGGFSGWFEIIQPKNNVYGSSYMAKQEQLVKVSEKNNTVTMELNWAKGYKNFKICEGEKRADGSCDPKYEKTTTLGGYIENQVNERGASAQHRIEIAKDFDSVVTVLVNELIKVAINKAFEGED